MWMSGIEGKFWSQEPERGWVESGGTGEGRQVSPARVGYWVPGHKIPLHAGPRPMEGTSTPASELGSDSPGLGTGWVTPHGREQEAVSSGLRILPDAASGSAWSSLCPGLSGVSLGEERVLVPSLEGS